MAKTHYGTELILDLHGCDTSKFTKKQLTKYVIELCKLLRMKRFGKPMYWIENRNLRRLKGASIVQFIETSDIVVHAPVLMKTVYINVFSCKKFDAKTARSFTENYFKAKKSSARIIVRG